MVIYLQERIASEQARKRRQRRIAEYNDTIDLWQRRCDETQAKLNEHKAALARFLDSHES